MLPAQLRGWRSAIRQGLLQATNGKFYGTTQHSGDLSCGANVPGCGTVFEITPGGGLTTLHTFQGADGAWPFGTLIQATDGHLYGTTLEGGSYTNPACGGSTVGCGTVFKMTPGGALTTFFSFCSTGDCSAYEPQAALLQATNGDFYTTTSLPNGDVVKLTPQADLTVLHKFDRNDGLHLMAPLIQATDGNFYGTAPDGGYDKVGTVFQITPAGKYTMLLSFGETNGDGGSPWGALVEGTDGNLYGTTHGGGLYGGGTIFRVTTEGKQTRLYNFSGPDGSAPIASLIQGTDGNFYGTTSEGGANNGGTVFSLNVGLAPFVIARPGTGNAGDKISILGTNLTGVTGVTFNGAPAQFTAHSTSVVTAIVPAGATSGTVQVTTAGGTLSSNVAFRVR